MKAIWKFPVDVAGQQVLQMPRGAQILCLREQADMPFMWALVEPDAPQEPRYFTTYGTGHDMPDDPGTYIGTTIHLGGSLVLHTFEQPGESA